MTLHLENPTGTILRRLTRRSLQSEKRRNGMVVIAVALGAFLLCLAGTIGASLLQIRQDQITDTYEATYAGVTQADIAALKEVPEIARVGTYYVLSTENSPRGFQATYLYVDQDLLYTFRHQMSLAQGRLPQEDHEVALGADWLAQYANGAGLGDAVTLDTPSFSGTYVVTGILGQETAAGAEFPMVLSHAALEGWADYDPAGYLAYVHLAGDQALSAEAIEAFYRQTAEDLDLPVPGFSNVYFRYHDSSYLREVLPMVLVLGALVLAGGCLVIQSIFRISIQDKIQSYGQLRTLGATARQIRRMVHGEGRRLGSLGLLAGVVLGALVGLALFPQGFHPLYYAAAILVTLVIGGGMVALAVRKPAKIAAGIAPLEAMRFVPDQRAVPPRKAGRGAFSPRALGWRNFRRDRRKTLSIALSLSLGGILLLNIASISLVQDPARMARMEFPLGDYKVYLSSDRAHADILAQGNPLTPALREEILAIDGVTDVVVTRQSLSLRYQLAGDASVHSTGMGDVLTQQNWDAVAAALLAGAMPEGDRSVLVASHVAEAYPEIAPGASLVVEGGGDPVTVTVAGVFDATKTAACGGGHGNLGLDAAILYAPAGLFQQLLPGAAPLDYAWSVVSDPSQDQAVAAGLEALVARHPEVGLDTYASRVEAFRQSNTMIYDALEVVSWLILLFGVVNLVNTTLSNQLTRRREQAMLRTLGMTRRQLGTMIAWEGLCYALTAAGATLAIGLPVAVGVCRTVSSLSYGGTIVPYQFPLPEMALFLGVLFGLELLLSGWSIRREEKDGLLERIGQRP